MILSIEGEKASGKTTLALSAPLPMVSFNFDMGIERAIKGGKYEELFAGLDILIVPYSKDATQLGDVPPWEGHDITIFELPTPIQLDSMRLMGNIALWTYFVNLAAAALADPKVPTIGVDTMTMARRTKASANLENLQNAAYDDQGNRIGSVRPREQLQQIEYGKVNNAIRDVYVTAEGSKKNLIATHHITDERKAMPGADGRIEQTLTGNRVLEGLGDTHNFVDVAILMSEEDGEIKGTLLKNGYNIAQKGIVLNNPTWDSIANLIAMGTGDRIEIGRRNNAHTTS
ncbi:hypothetical protein LCGC14_2302980 [marine sediment metagenome]|uniref:Uncharacterized protein n=1 Tax=marine sediment metagenome TaxID=412755 RepID=A0A0F9CMW5_9ZZZZ